jgi:diadenosine tetraphosphate (Ap4A) HIT family hydrolase
MPTDNSADARTPENPCVFCNLRYSQLVVMRNDFAFALRDASPVTPLHTLVLPFRHTPTYFDLTDQEIAAANDLLRRLRAEILAADLAVQGFNIGANVGTVSGQTIFHCHIHIIPRRAADLDDPRGGVRGVIPDRMRY